MERHEDESFYGDAKKHWETIAPTVDGMLGGFAKISPTDINGSREFMRPFITVVIIILSLILSGIKCCIVIYLKCICTLNQYLFYM
jgi:hypothetical protein